MNPSILDAIVASSRRSAAVREAHVPLSALNRRARPVEKAAAFGRALTAPEGATLPRVIAECKRRSPSNGILRPEYDPAAIARAYERAGAAAISVLTESAFFDGALQHLALVRDAVSVPVLRKDFIVTRYQIAEARAAGADAVLLIVAALDDASLRWLIEVADGEGIDALVETHDAEEIERALTAGARIVGVNSRNLHTLEVDTGIFATLARMIPSGVLAVAESGIRDASTMARLVTSGYDACLIGERFMSAPDPGAALGDLLGAA